MATNTRQHPISAPPVFDISIEGRAARRFCNTELLTIADHGIGDLRLGVPRIPLADTIENHLSENDAVGRYVSPHCC